MRTTAAGPYLRTRSTAPGGAGTSEVAGLRLLGGASGLDLRPFRHDHVSVRIDRALKREGCVDIVSLARRLRGDILARERFRRSLAVPVSRMFRDAEQFDLIEREVLPQLPRQGRRLAVWSAGCADGSELATIALLLQRDGLADRGLLLGSDLLDENIVAARRARFPDVPAGVRSRLRFERRDLVADPPPGCRFHLVLCRNVAIYLAGPARRILERRLVDALLPDGFLMIGRSERLARPEALGLRPVARHLYRKAA